MIDSSVKIDERLRSMFGMPYGSAEQELDAAWVMGDALNNARAMLRYCERKRNECPWWNFISRWGWHYSVARAELAVQYYLKVCSARRC